MREQYLGISQAAWTTVALGVLAGLFGLLVAVGSVGLAVGAAVGGLCTIGSHRMASALDSPVFQSV